MKDDCEVVSWVELTELLLECGEGDPLGTRNLLRSYCKTIRARIRRVTLGSPARSRRSR